VSVVIGFKGGAEFLASDIENIKGSAFGDFLGGTDEANRLDGGNGDDRLQGNLGDDVLCGGAGADQLFGGSSGTDAGIDLASYFGAAIGVTVNLQTGVGANGDAQGDTYAGIENVNGGAAADIITGNAAANVLNGFEGNDRLTGGAGRDTLAGGVGADAFIFTTIGDSVVGANADRISDFSRAQGDRIDLSTIDASSAAAGNQAFSFIGSALYHHVADELRFAVAGGTTTIAGDINGDGSSDFHIVLSETVALIAADFVL
jgi:Ca2+-binding RTX toxin-like protein